MNFYRPPRKTLIAQQNQNNALAGSPAPWLNYADYYPNWSQNPLRRVTWSQQFVNRTGFNPWIDRNGNGIPDWLEQVNNNPDFFPLSRCPPLYPCRAQHPYRRNRQLGIQPNVNSRSFCVNSTNNIQNCIQCVQQQGGTYGQALGTCGPYYY